MNVMCITTNSGYKSVVHDCEKEMCYRCKKYEKNHVCFIKPIMSRTKSDNPVLFFSILKLKPSTAK